MSEIALEVCRRSLLRCPRSLLVCPRSPLRCTRGRSWSVAHHYSLHALPSCTGDITCSCSLNAMGPLVQGILCAAIALDTSLFRLKVQFYYVRVRRRTSPRTAERVHAYAPAPGGSASRHALIHIPQAWCPVRAYASPQECLPALNMLHTGTASTV